MSIARDLDRKVFRQNLFREHPDTRCEPKQMNKRAVLVGIPLEKLKNALAAPDPSGASKATDDALRDLDRPADDPVFR